MAAISVSEAIAIAGMLTELAEKAQAANKAEITTAELDASLENMSSSIKTLEDAIVAKRVQIVALKY